MRVWQEQYVELGSREEINHVLIFENKGEVVGVSNLTPIARSTPPTSSSRPSRQRRESPSGIWPRPGVLFQDILKAEREDGRRIIFENESAIVFLPYFARYAYEVFVAPKAWRSSIAALSEAELRDFAEALKRLLVKFDNLWRAPFPYVMPLHQAPTDGGDHRGFHFHIEFHPPLRRPNLLKYLAGPEIGGGNFLSDTSPEEKAAELRAQPEVHYKQTR